MIGVRNGFKNSSCMLGAYVPVSFFRRRGFRIVPPIDKEACASIVFKRFKKSGFLLRLVIVTVQEMAEQNLEYDPIIDS